MKRKKKCRFGLQMKFTALFLGCMSLIFIVVIVFTESINGVMLDERYHAYAVSIAKLTAGMISAEEVLYYKDTGVPDERYEEILNDMQGIQEQTDIHYLYVIYPVSETEGIYIFDVALKEETDIPNAIEANTLGTRVDLEKGFDGIKEVMENGSTSQKFDYDGTIDDMTATLATAYAPILDENQNAVAFVGVDMDIEKIRDDVKVATLIMKGVLIILMIICFILLALIVHFFIINPVHRLRRYAEKISAGKFGDVLPVRGHDEISEITAVFNQMSQNIQGHMEEIQGINQGYQKYVPSDLFSILEKESITQMELGNRASRFVTLLSFQLKETEENRKIRDSQQILEDMNFLFQTTIPVIMEQHGFVERFQDTGMLAVFRDSTEEAVRSAISICQKMNRYQEREGGIPPSFSMGITYGGVLFGNVGQEQRMATISISSYTSMARFLQKLAPFYGSRLLIASGALKQLAESSTSYHYRFIGMVENKYSQVVEKVYDIYDGDSEEQREGKERTKELFEKGVELFCMRRFRESRQVFVEVLKRFRKDTAAKRYLQMCNRYYQMEKTNQISIFMHVK